MSSLLVVVKSHSFPHTHMHTHAPHTHIHTHMCTHTRTHTHLYTHTHMHTHAHNIIHTHIGMQRRELICLDAQTALLVNHLFQTGDRLLPRRWKVFRGYYIYWKISWTAHIPFSGQAFPRNRFEQIFWMLHMV